MDIQDIAVLPIAKHMSPEVKYLRQSAPEFIQSVIERTYAVKEVSSLKEMTENSIAPLSGGMMSAVYALKAHDFRVIKFRYKGIIAEAKSLREWRRHGASVVAVKHTGLVPETKGTSHQVKYLILESVVDREGRPAQTAYTYTLAHPERARSVGRALGRELAHMHRAKSDRTFGEFADMWGKKAPYKTWNSYLRGRINANFEFLQSIGISQELLHRLKESVDQMRFRKHGVYCHGDFSMRNAMMVSERPVRLKIFDPNPLIGDPSWDLAILYNNAEYARRKYEKAPSNLKYREEYERERDCLLGLIEGYEAVTGRRINERHVAASQLAQTFWLLYVEYQKAIKRRKDPTKEIEVVVRRESIMSKILQLVDAEYARGW